MHFNTLNKLVTFISQMLLWYPGRFCLYYFLHLKIFGMEHIKTAERMSSNKNVGVIFACTHQSEFDPIVVQAGVPPFTKLFPMFFVSSPLQEFRETNFGWRNHLYNLSWFLKMWGAFPLVRGTKSYAHSLSVHVAILNSGSSVCIFPEGGYRVKKNEPGGGVGYLALKTGAIVVPTTMKFWKDSNTATFFGRGMNMSMEYHEPLTYEMLDDPSVEHCKVIAKEIMNIAQK